MQGYFDEFCFRYNFRKVSNLERFKKMITNVKIRVTQIQIAA